MFKIVNDGKLPERATKFSAGFDVFSNEDIIIGAGETVLVGLGICLDKIDNFVSYCQYHGILSQQNPCYDDFSSSEQIEFFKETNYLELHPRSSLRAKGLGGGVGIIDMDYREEIKIVITNYLTYESFNNGSYFEIKRGDKIGQLILCRHEGFMLPKEYTKDEERIGGFGSTGGE